MQDWQTFGNLNVHNLKKKSTFMIGICSWHVKKWKLYAHGVKYKQQQQQQQQQQQLIITLAVGVEHVILLGVPLRILY